MSTAPPKRREIKSMLTACSPKDAIDDSPQAIGFHYAYHHAVETLLRVRDHQEVIYKLCEHFRALYACSDAPYAWQNAQNPLWARYFDKGVAMLCKPNKWSKPKREKYELPLPIIPSGTVSGRMFWRLDVMSYESAKDAEKICTQLFNQFASMELVN